MASKYVDKTAIVHVIGNIYKNSELLDNEKYSFREEDFQDNFHRVVFGTIFNLHGMGVKEINLIAINDYLKDRLKPYTTYKNNHGDEWLQEVAAAANLNTFNYYYERMKKFTLLRMYDSIGMDVSFIYDVNNILDVKKKQEQEDFLDKSTLLELADLIDDKIEGIKLTYADGADDAADLAGNGLDELLLDLETNPDFGIPMYGKLVNTIHRGARLKKVYLRSAETGVGKSRAMIADVCSFACDTIFNPETQKWEYTGPQEPTVFISTEQETSEVQTMMIAFVACVDELHILENRCTKEEKERVKEAIKIIKKSPLYIKELPDFGLVDIENTIKKEIREHQVRYVAFDYIHSSMKILSEISTKSGIKGMREDNILFMIGVRLKDLANQYGVFILSSTQLNGEVKEAKVYDQKLLRGAKSLGDKIDWGAIMLDVTQDDLTKLQPILKDGGFPAPNMKMSIYKNRRGKYKNVLLWCNSDKSTCRLMNPMFATNYNFEIVEIEDTNIQVKEKK